VATPILRYRRGWRVYDWALIDSDHPDHQYLICRFINDGELAFYHCYNPHHAGSGQLVGVAGARWPIEECFGSGKKRSRTRPLPSPHLGRLAPTYYPRRARPHLPRHHRTHHQKRGDSTLNSQTNTTTNPANRPNKKLRHPSTDALSFSRPMVSAGDEVSVNLLAGCAAAGDVGLWPASRLFSLSYGGGRLRAWHKGTTSTTFCRSDDPKRLVLSGTLPATYQCESLVWDGQVFMLSPVWAAKNASMSAASATARLVARAPWPTSSS
jgi:hypothetical protein